MMKPSLPGLLGLLLLCSQVPLDHAMAQGVPSDPGFVVIDESVSQPGEPGTPFGPRYRIYSQFGDGLGYDDGQTSVGAFLPWHVNPYQDMIFIDARGYGAYNGDGGGGNFGLGYRGVMGSAIGGISGWLDLDGAHVKDHYRAGLSGELLWSNVEFRANGYFALGDQSRSISSGLTGDPFFSGNNIFLTSRTVTEDQYYGMDAEVGGPIGNLGLYAYVGGFYLDSDEGTSTGGVKVRVEEHVTENVQVGMQFNNSNAFGSNALVTLNLQFPSGKPLNEWARGPAFRNRTFEQSLARQVEREYRIPTRIRTEDTSVVLIDPQSGLPIFVIHVDPQADSGGLGTFESPFGNGSLVNSGAANIILVRQGSYSSAVPIGLFDDQRLLATTAQHVFTSTIGTFALPGFETGDFVGLTNTSGGPTVVLANDNEVAGFEFTGTGSGVFGTEISAYNVNRNRFTGLFDGVLLLNAGDGLITQNHFQGNTNGVRIAAMGGTSGPPLISENLFDGGNDDGVEIVAAAGGTVTNAIVSTNTFANNDSSGVHLVANEATTTATLVSNSISSSNGSGVLAEATGAAAAGGAATTLTAFLTSNSTSGNGNMGVRGVGSGFNSTLNLNLDSNTSTGDIDAGFGMELSDEAAGNLFAQSNTVTGTLDNGATLIPQGDGFFVSRVDNTIATVVLGDADVNNGAGGNAISNTAGAGVRYFGNGLDQTAAVGNLASLFFADENVITGTGDSGIEFNLVSDGAVQAVIYNNDFSNTGGFFLPDAAISFQTANNSSFGLPLQPVNGEDRNGDGILQAYEDVNQNGVLDTVAPTMLSSVIDSNRITDAQAYGIAGVSTGGSFVDVRVSGTTRDSDGNLLRTTITDAQIDGIRFDNTATETVPGSPPSTYVVQGTDITGSAVHGLHLEMGGGQKTVLLGGPGLGQDLNVLNSAPVLIPDTNILINNSGGSNVYVLNNVVSSGASGNGLTVNQTSGNVLFNVTNSSFSNNGLVGTEVNVNTGLTFFANYNFGNEDASFNFVSTSPNGVIDGYVTNDGTTTGIVSTNEDVNGNGVLDPGEDVNGNGNLDFNEDVDKNGALGNAGNMFSNNGAQGFFFGTLAATPTTDTLDVADPAIVQNAANFGSTFLAAGAYANTTPTLDVFARLNFYGNSVFSNGASTLNQVDGMVLQVGTSTQLVASVAQNTFGGNILNDFRVVTVVSADPAAGTNNVAPGVDRVALDPMGILDLAFGQNFSGTAPMPGEAPINGNAGNVGESIFVSTIGSSVPLFGRTETGLFTNTDFVKPANRNAFMVLNIYTPAGNPLFLDDVSTGGLGSPGNLFSQEVGGFFFPTPVANALSNTGFFIGGGSGVPFFVNTTNTGAALP